MKTIFNFRQLIDQSGMVFTRFPLVMFFATLTTIILLYQTGDKGNIALLNQVRLPFTGWVMFLAMLNLQLLREVFRWKDKLYYISVAFSFLAGALLYSFLPSEIHESVCRWFFISGLVLILHLTTTFIPFRGPETSNAFLHHNIQVLGNWLRAAFYSLIWYLAATLILVALDKLFGIRFGAFSYIRLFILSAGILHSFYFLSSFPHDFTEQFTLNTKALFVILVRFALIPIVGIYGIILYAYILKLFITGQEIELWVSELVVWYFVSGIITWLFVSTFHDEVHNKLSIFFKKWFYLFSAPLIFFMIYTLIKEIENDGITDWNYLKALITSWLVLLLIRKEIFNKFSYTFIPLSLSGFIIVGFMSGPFSVCKVPDKNQQKRLTEKLEYYGIIRNGVLVTSDTIVWYDSTGKIAQQLSDQYAKNKLDFLRKFDSNQIIPHFDSTFYVDDFLRKIGINSGYESAEALEYYNFSCSEKITIDLEGYSKMIPVLNVWDSDPPGLYARMYKKGFQIYRDEKLLEEINILGSLPYPSNEVREKPLILDFNDENYKIKFIMNSCYGNGKWPEIEISEMQAFLLFSEIR